MDQFTLEIIENALVAVGDEMFWTLQRTAQSSLIFEVLDFAVGVTDATGELVAQGNGVAGFLGTLDAAVLATIEKHGSSMVPGDIFMTNDPYGGGGTHLSDVSIVMPVFFEGEIVAFTVNKAHWSELGGKDPGSVSADATEVFQEGLQLPNIRLFERGEVDQSILDLIGANCRLPRMTLGDLWAGVAAARVGEKRIAELCGKYGKKTVETATERLLEYGERMARLELSKLPKGTFEAEDWIDDDGTGDGPFKVVVAVTIDDDGMLVDFTGSCDQVVGPINSTYTGLVSSVRSVYKAVTNPSVPANGGGFRPLRVIAPEGSIFHARRPAPVSMYFESMLFGSDLVWKALAEHIPERLTAGHLLSVCATKVYGTHPDTGDFWMIYEPLVGGWGAGADKDGEPGQFCVGDGETYNIPIEITEQRYGITVDQYALHSEDGGAGEFRGGKGVILDYRVSGKEAFVTATFNRSKIPPWGMLGGRDGTPNYVEIHRVDGGVETYGHTPEGVHLAHGDVVRLITATGGGCGDPGSRSHDRVLDDVKNGYITAEQAAKNYGVEVGGAE
jgi:N-methylhydantoinase B